MTDALYPWHKGGKEVRYLQLLDGLPKQGMDVDVYSMKWWSEAPNEIRFPAGSLSYTAICPRVPLYRCARRSTWQAVLFAVSTIRLLRRRFDVIEADQMPYLQLFPLRAIAWLKRVPLVITWNEVWGRDRWRSYIGRLGFVAAFIERISIKLPDAIIAISSGTGDKLRENGANPQRTFVVPVALDLEHLLNAPEDELAPELLFVGRLLEHKHANLAIEATRILVERGVDVHLGIVGIGPEELRLRSLVADLNLGSRVKFYGSIDSQQELWSLVRGSRVLLAPSVREGLGLVVAESLALGTPVVCALHEENESSKLVGSSTGSLVPPFDAPAIANAAEYWLDVSTPRAQRMATFLAEHEELTVGAMSALYAEILRNVA